MYVSMKPSFVGRLKQLRVSVGNLKIKRFSVGNMKAKHLSVRDSVTLKIFCGYPWIKSNFLWVTLKESYFLWATLKQTNCLWVTISQTKRLPVSCFKLYVFLWVDRHIGPTTQRPHKDHTKTSQIVLDIDAHTCVYTCGWYVIRHSHMGT